MLLRLAFASLALVGSAAPALAQDAAAGEKAFRACQACHTIEEGAPHRVGPNLYGVVGRKAAAAEGYTYSQALRQADLTWTEDTLDAFLEAPRDYVPGTKMVYPGVKDPQQRQDLIAYLKQAGGQ